MRNAVQDTYQKLFDKYKEDYAQNDRLFKQYSIFRLVIFVTGVGLGYLVLTWNFGLGILTFGLFIALFLYLVKRHAKIEAKRLRAQNLQTVNERELAALGGDYSAFDGGEELVDPKHDYSYDLDIFGQKSVFQAINRTASVLGKEVLSGWFKRGLTDKETIQARQKAHNELADKLNFRQEFLAIGTEQLEAENDQDRLMRWLEVPAFYLNHPLYKILIYLMPALMALLVGLSFVVPWITWHFPVFLALVNLAIVRQNLPQVGKAHAVLSRRNNMLERYADLLHIIEQEPFEADLLQTLQSHLNRDGVQASERIKTLASISRDFDNRLNVFVAFLFNATILWDLLCMRRLEKWKESAKDELPSWFEVLGQFDALISLGGFAYNHPDYSWPTINTDAFVFQANEMGHPLLDPEVRVDNNLTMEGDGQYVIVTGANMAGKSTFLRTVGVNLVLGMMGAPVCAQAFSFSPMHLLTSVRATDSLQDNESYFYAELLRLKYIVDELKGGQGHFIILDEMLRGTNSRDKQTGSRGYIEQLLGLKAMGLIATHDLSLGTLIDDYPDQIKNRRFEVNILEDRLDFDYKLKEGISQNLNATFLMRKMGIMA